MTIRVGSLFSGIGGLDLGLERAGARVVWQCEIDPACQRVLRRRFPDAILYDDVSRLRGAEVGAVDILVGGFPCQDLSVAGKRAGLKGERSGLFHEFMRLASELAPRWVIIENVPGLLSSNAGRDMGTVLGTLGDLGYGFAYRVLDAQYFGVAQRRRRVFIVGCLGDAAGSAQVLFEPEGVRRNPPTRAAARARITGTLAASAGTGGLGGIGQSNSAITSRIVEATARTVSLRGREGGGTAELGGEIATALRASQGGGDKSYALVETVSTIQGGSRRGYRIDCRERRGGGQLIPTRLGTNN